ncbi:hypothetical protein PENTCL1PPCAC_22229 [Pristionchus entomophagus]|uniref:Tetratricopeptide repeat protein n=1 Tax=Pristionchus entomophagus TaxID=358040 RepID=A0AAV5U0U8_9BILA|nr:hypothetical protein PENTCL1PPCAC_22229 [Pristionchus entomophagus]
MGKVRTVDVAGARVKLMAALNKRIDLRDADIEVIVPMSSLSRRPQVGEIIRVRVDLARPLRCAIDEAMDAFAGPPTMPDYIVDSSSYSSWSEKEFPLMLNRHAEESVGAGARGSNSFLKEVHSLEHSYTAKRKRKEAQARAMVTQGISSMRAGERDTAWSMLREATDLYPPCADAYVALGALLVNDGRSSESEKYFQRALQYEPAHKNALLYYKQVLFGAASLHEKESRWMDAMGYYEKAIHDKIDVDEAATGVERCKKEMNEEEKKRRARSPSIEIVDPPKPDSAATAGPASVKRPRISEGVRKSSDGQRKSSIGEEKTVLPSIKPVQLQQAERKRLSDLEQLHSLLKNEATKK